MHVTTIMKLLCCFEGVSPVLQKAEALLTDPPSRVRRLGEVATPLLQQIAGKVISPLVRNDDAELSKSAGVFLAEINEELAARLDRGKTIDDLRPEMPKQSLEDFKQKLGYLLETTSGASIAHDEVLKTLEVTHKPSRDGAILIHICNEKARTEETFNVLDLIALARLANLDLGVEQS